MNDNENLQLLRFFANYVTEHKKKLMDQVLNNRTRHITVVLEDIFKPHNASAVLRTCDCFGIQDVHVIENENKYEVNPYVVRGASKWVTLHKYDEKPFNTKDCFKKLRREGYKLVATSPKPNSMPVDQLGVNDKVAVIFGTEMSGLSEYALENADMHMHIPIYGFTESFNISVSAAICLNIMVNKLINSNVSWGLGDNEKNALRLDWYKKVVKHSEILEREFINTISRD